MSDHIENGKPQFRAQTIELFFDLVFVYTITRITHLVEHAHGAVDYLHAFAVLMLVWWMYGGYIWLTNHAHTPKTMRLVLMAAMAGFMVMALSSSATEGEGLLTFGLAYLFIVVLHFVAFAAQGGRAAALAMLRIVPFNLLAALLVLAGGVIDAEWSWVLLLAPAALYLSVAVMNTGEGFALDPAHFVERHGLLLIIVLGETIIAVGAGIGDGPLNAATIMRLALGIALIALLWWSYFDADDERAEHIMLAADNRRRTRIALFGYTIGHLAMIAGLILVAAGLKAAVGAPGGEEGHGSEMLLAPGVAVYLAADAFFRRLVGLAPVAVRLVAALFFALVPLLHLPLHGAFLIAALAAGILLALLAEAGLSRTRAALLRAE
ncbi:low temperature requirement protein A [Rhizobium cremeum]|uniref:low temperature requirement protein A n=1 Tax=Rhizobium cremeum TaxID=2813827 RepID=UPI000DD843DC|nr:low temperature requirement protein A [Rhizobium cremeum]MCJ7996008.1 low temperature requirement protein A [Rhizobium cremeum]MCJ8001267.1 low temperature requirement protein A [Rhizobium cremeum]